MGVSVSMKKKKRSLSMSPSMLARKERMDSLVSSVRSSRQSRRALVASFAFEMGLSLETVQEYVQVLIDARILELGEDRMVQLVGSRHQ